MGMETEREELGEMDDLFPFHCPEASSFLKKFLSNNHSDDTTTTSATMKRTNSDYSTPCLLKKASIICSIKDAIADGSVPEEILDSLLIIEQVDRKQGISVSDSMRAAFCAVALHCTFSHLTRSWPCYYDSVQRIWSFRIRNLEDSQSSQLIGPDLTKWREDVEAALWDSEASQRLLRINTRGQALQCIRVYLEEARSLMKPAFHLLASAAKLDTSAAATASQDSTPRPAAASQSSDPPPAGSSSSRSTGLRSSRSGLRCSSRSAPPAQATAPPHPCTDKGEGILKVNSRKRLKPGASHRLRGPVIIAESKEEPPTCNRYASLSTAEINKVQHALKSSTADLLAAVTDPLPEALEVAERVASHMVGKILNTVEECNKDKEALTASANHTMDVPATFVNPTRKPAQAMEGNHENQANKVLRPSLMERNGAQAMEGNHENQANKVLRPSLMERNGTAQTYEWEDSIDVSSEGTSSCLKRCRLPSPRIQLVSPLKEHQPKKWTRRRKRNMWAVEEEEALMEGVKKYSNHWKLILTSNPGAFNNRTDVDLKDKWRNMTGL